MKTLKGVEKFKEKLPNYQGKKIIVVPLIGITGLTTGLIIQLFFDYLSRIFSENPSLKTMEPYNPFIGSMLTILLAFYLISGIWRRKDNLLKKNKSTAYQKVILPGFFGITMIFSVIFHNFVPFVTWGPKPINPATKIVGTSMIQLLLDSKSNIYISNVVLTSFAIILLVYGIMAIIRTFFLFGMDYMGLVYTVYPDESEVRNEEIYKILRHPTYSIIMLIGLASFIFRFSLYSFIIIVFLRIFFYFHLKYYEEKELIERFGRKYEEYRDEVPALFPRLSDIGTHIKFTLGLSKAQKNNNDKEK